MRSYTLKNICLCNFEQQIEVLKIRNTLNIRKFMYTDHIISEFEHVQYIRSLAQSANQQVLVVLKNAQVAVGVVSLSQIDYDNKKCEWAFYLAEEERNGLGAAIEFAILDMVFVGMGLCKLNCEVLENNDRVVEMHKKFGFEVEGFSRSNIVKNGVRFGVFLLGITNFEWLKIREAVKERIFLKTSDISIMTDV